MSYLLSSGISPSLCSEMILYKHFTTMQSYCTQVLLTFCSLVIFVVSYLPSRRPPNLNRNSNSVHNHSNFQNGILDTRATNHLPRSQFSSIDCAERDHQLEQSKPTVKIRLYPAIFSTVLAGNYSLIYSLNPTMLLNLLQV